MQGSLVRVAPHRFSSRWTTWSLACVLLGLSACSTTVFDNEKVNYKSDSRAKPVSLEVPPDLTQLSRDSRYAMPGGSVSAASLEQEKRTAAGVTAPAAIADVRIERSGTQRWLVVQRPADRVWPVVREFWLENGFTFTTEQPSTGLLETDWAENRAKLPQDFLRRTLGKVLDPVTDRLLFFIAAGGCALGGLRGGPVSALIGAGLVHVLIERPVTAALTNRFLRTRTPVDPSTITRSYT